MEMQIHHIEQEAYSSVLRAFKAQSDAITWVSFLTNCLFFEFIKFIFMAILLFPYNLNFYQEKESLITELRKELRVSDEEHRKLLSRVNADEVIKRIRFDYSWSFILNMAELACTAT